MNKILAKLGYPEAKIKSLWEYSQHKPANYHRRSDLGQATWFYHNEYYSATFVLDRLVSKERGKN